MTRPSNRYELLSCALGGHVLVGTDAAHVDDGDYLVVRQHEGVRWHRCLRCDGWLPHRAPEDPARPTVPGRDEIELPLRGPLLRDRYVLRLIAVDRALHVLVLSVLAIVIIVYIGHRGAIIHDYDSVMNSLTGGPNGGNDLGGVLSHFRHYLLIKPRHLYDVLLVVLLYAALEATEMVGLWLGKRWAEYLTLVATVLLIPLEVYELVHGLSILKVATLVVNVAIALYLLLSKRLFGLRGGYRAERARREEGSGWSALERASAPLAVPRRGTTAPAPGGGEAG